MNVIYTTAFGHQLYYDMAAIHVKSVRKSGYQGRLIVLSESPYEFPGAENIVVDISNQLCKSALPKEIIAQADKIMLLDSDIHCRKNPEILFAESDTENLFAQEPIFVPQHPLNSTFISDSDKEKYKDTHALNGGTFMLQTDQANELFRTWNTLNRIMRTEVIEKYFKGTIANSKQMNDQSILEPMRLYSELKISTFPLEYVYMPGVVALWPKCSMKFNKEKCVLIHLNGAPNTREGKEKTLDLMKRFCAHIEPEEDLCEEYRMFSGLSRPGSQIQIILDRLADQAKEIGDLGQAILTLNKKMEVIANKFEAIEETMVL